MAALLNLGRVATGAPQIFPKRRSKKQPTLRQAMIWIAQLGGFLARQGDGNPGVKTWWRGLTKLHSAYSLRHGCAKAAA